MRRWPVGAFLVLLVSALVLPGLLFSAVLLGRIATSERARLAVEAQAATTRTVEALDRELTGQQATLRALASSPALAEGDLRTFYNQARDVVAAADCNVVLNDLSGQMLLNTCKPFGPPLPHVGAPEFYARAANERRLVVSNLFTGAVDGEPTLTVALPVLRGSDVAYVLSINLTPARLSGILASQGLPPDWALSVVDGNDAIIARSDQQDRYVGQLATGDLREHATGERGTWIGTTVDGTEVFAAYASLRLADWRVAAGVPVAALEAPLRRVLLALSLAGVAVLALSFGMAWLLSAQLVRPLRALAKAGIRLGRGEPVRRVRFRVTEVDNVSHALANASANLAARAGALAAERARLTAIFESVPLGLIIAEAPSGRIVAGNARVERIVRHPILPSRDVDAYAEWAGFHADGRRVASEEYPLARALRGEERPDMEFRYRRGDGTTVWLHSAAAPVRDGQGGITGAVVAMTDIDEVVQARERSARFAEELERVVAERTARLEQALAQLHDEVATRAAVEEQLRQAQKMEAVGQLTGGIAHDFNNLLTVVVGSLDLLRRRVEEPRALRLVDNAIGGATRAATLTSRLLAFSRRQPLAPQLLDVNELVSGMTDMLRHTLGEAVRLETMLETAGALLVHADVNQLENALLNLAVNARDAMEGAPGTLTIRTGATTLDEAEAERVEVEPGPYVTVTVSDTGSGMLPDVLAQAFDPFFTTKPLGQGTGLGLSQVHGFVKQSGGHVAIEAGPIEAGAIEMGAIEAGREPGPGRGATVCIILPRRDREGGLGGTSARDRIVPLAKPGEAVLVVEDEAGVRSFSSEALRELGYAVIEAPDAEAALAALTTHPEVVLLFTDLSLPGADGRALADEARRRRPGLGVLFTTGHARGGTVWNARLDPAADLLAKPFTLEALAVKVRTVLDGPAPDRPA